MATALRGRGLEAPLAPLVRLPFASRRRATLTAAAGRSGELVGYLAARSHDLVDVAACPALDPSLAASWPAIRAIGAALARHAGHARLTATLCANGVDVAATLQPSRSGRGRRPRPAPPMLAVDDPAIARLTVDGDIALLREPPVVRFDGVNVPFPPGAFLQPSRTGEATLTRLVLAGVGEAGRVVDAFCGLGTFAVPITAHARVTAVDADGPALDALAAGMARASGRRPLTVARRNLMRDPLSLAELNGVEAVVFDPPRAGAEALAQGLANSTVPRIVAVSCEPRTLARDLAHLVAGGYKITQVTPVDQFVGTGHIEAVAELRRDE
ncbi:class I SAM-dependent RNA methyltransferase [Acuticoccus sp.]|uniref:class I SAM-dependent RNA methyltransferase n=1 Tax=Acuticoccus sp. TaxID=1904378 RepID=UPI003B52262E